MQNNNTKSFKFSKKIKINFDGGELSSDAGMLLIHEFCCKLGIEELLLEHLSEPRDNLTHRKHQIVYQKLMRIIAGYTSNNHVVFLKNDPVFQQIHTGCIASASSCCRREKEFTFADVKALQEIQKILQVEAYEIAGMPEEVNLDFDTTYDPASANLHGSKYNTHYGVTGFNPLVCFDGRTGDFIKGNLRPGNNYCSKKIVQFAEPIFKKYKKLGIKIKTRSDSGFACPEFYEMCERRSATYYIKLKSNARLGKQIEAEVLTADIMKNRKDTYGEIRYGAKSWGKERRVLIRIQWHQEQLFPIYTAIVTNDEVCTPTEGFKFYNGRATIENSIEEGKNGFNWDHLSNESFESNSVNFQIHLLAFQVIQLFRRICLPIAQEKSTIHKIRLMLIKIATKVIKGGRNIIIKCASCCPFQDLFMTVLEYIQQIHKYKHSP